MYFLNRFFNLKVTIFRISITLGERYILLNKNDFISFKAKNFLSENRITGPLAFRMSSIELGERSRIIFFELEITSSTRIPKNAEEPRVYAYTSPSLDKFCQLHRNIFQLMVSALCHHR